MNDLRTQTEEQLLTILKCDCILRDGRFNNLPQEYHQLVADTLVELRKRKSA